MADIDLEIEATLESDKRMSLPCDIPVRVEDWELNSTLTAASTMGFISLENFILNLKACDSVPSEEFCRSLILGIISRLEQANKDLDGEEIITVKDVYITKDTEHKTVVIQCQVIETNGETEVTRPTLQDELVKVFCYILTNGDTDNDTTLIHCLDKNIAVDFLNKLWESPPKSWNELTKHPFFWSDASKIEFIMRYFGSIRSPDTVVIENATQIRGICLNNDYKTDEWGSPDVENKLNSANLNSELVKGWITKLFLKDDEVPLSCTSKRKDDTVSSTSKIAVVKEALEPYWNTKSNTVPPDPYNGDSIFDLVRFFRNTHAHFLQMKKNIQECFGGSDGYWPFFSRRYPRMFIDVYEASKRQKKGNLEPTPPPETKFLSPLKFK